MSEAKGPADESQAKKSSSMHELPGEKAFT